MPNFLEDFKGREETDSTEQVCDICGGSGCAECQKMIIPNIEDIPEDDDIWAAPVAKVDNKTEPVLSVPVIATAVESLSESDVKRDPFICERCQEGYPNCTNKSCANY